MNKNEMPFEKNRLRDLRRESNLTCKELSEKIGVAQQTITKWENGQVYPSFDKLKKLAHYFGVSTDYLLGNSDEKNSYQKEKDFNTPIADYRTRIDLSNRWNKCFANLNNKQLEILVTIAESFTKNV